jgi:hypothetical protein
MKPTREASSYPQHLVGPAAGVIVALGGAAVVVLCMLLVGVRELSLPSFVPEMPIVQALSTN